MADAIVIGSGPNGLAAAIRLAQAGVSVKVIEAADSIGGGTRTAELTLPGFHHDVCSSVHPMGAVSPFFRTLPLAEHGLNFIEPPASVAHPLSGGRAAFLTQPLEETAAELRIDAKAYRKLLQPLVAHADEILADALNPTAFPRHPLRMARFGMTAVRSARALAGRFQSEEARALIAGCAAHSILPLEAPLTAAVALIFLLTGHMRNWPIAEGGSAAITKALASYLKALGGTIETGMRITGPKDLPAARAYLFDTSPDLLAENFSALLPAGYVKKLRRFRYGPGVFKIDYALSQPIPWQNPAIHNASTVHLGGTFNEIAEAEAAVWQGEHPQKPFVLLTQQSHFDASRAPAGKHTLWAYCHVPAYSTTDMSSAIEAQIERFAPGFSRTILHRSSMHSADFQRYNANYVGGAIAGGVADWRQFVFRPVASLNPYATPNQRLFLCSASTPPGGGVHGMCGFHAAEKVLQRLENLPHAPLA